MVSHRPTTSPTKVSAALTAVGGEWPGRNMS